MIDLTLRQLAGSASYSIQPEPSFSSGLQADLSVTQGFGGLLEGALAREPIVDGSDNPVDLAISIIPTQEPKPGNMLPPAGKTLPDESDEAAGAGVPRVETVMQLANTVERSDLEVVPPISRDPVREVTSREQMPDRMPPGRELEPPHHRVNGPVVSTRPPQLDAGPTAIPETRQGRIDPDSPAIESHAGPHVRDHRHVEQTPLRKEQLLEPARKAETSSPQADTTQMAKPNHAPILSQQGAPLAEPVSLRPIAQTQELAEQAPSKSGIAEQVATTSIQQEPARSGKAAPPMPLKSRITEAARTEHRDRSAPPTAIVSAVAATLDNAKSPDDTTASRQNFAASLDASGSQSPASISQGTSTLSQAVTQPQLHTQIPSPTHANAPQPLTDIRHESRPANALESVIDHLTEARETGRVAKSEVTLRHQEFGAINMRFEVSGFDLRATLSARDPAFVAAAQIALVDRAIAATGESAGAQSQRGQEQSQGQHGQQSQTGQHGSQGEPRYGSSLGSGQGSPQPYSSQTKGGDEEGDLIPAPATHESAGGAAQASDLFA
ncbi:hypothetical protein CD351_03870 [Erythrobacter sp. KY5]|uniref:hypothetical protein n=1 Tax=Erythrobacter sp. KY5 TaxID=2011159 RepID=UPI000DBF2E4F|nr:hypothetical protein [Erythrobacter sp. KY5]AWW73564.1 hypothetical protein CD351_03870 [Erythrobacter sp. KY5]